MSVQTHMASPGQRSPNRAHLCLLAGRTPAVGRVPPISDPRYPGTAAPACPPTALGFPLEFDLSLSDTCAVAEAREGQMQSCVDVVTVNSLGSWSKQITRSDLQRTNLGASQCFSSIFLEEAGGIWKRFLGSCCVAHGRINTALKESIRDN